MRVARVLWKRNDGIGERNLPTDKNNYFIIEMFLLRFKNFVVSRISTVLRSS